MPAKVIPVHLDVGNLLVEDINPVEIDPSQLSKDKVEKALEALTRDNLQLLFNSLFALPTKRTDSGIMAELPKGTLKLPREKPVPKDKPLTRWEKFAKAKGIQKKKRSAMVFDDDSGEYKARHGGRSNKNEKDNLQDWCVELKPGQTPSTD